MRRRTPSIQPKHSASSTDSGQVMLGRPEPFLWKPTSSSVAIGVVGLEPGAEVRRRGEELRFHQAAARTLAHAAAYSAGEQPTSALKSLMKCAWSK